MGKKISKSVKKQLLNIAFLVLLVGITLVILCLSNRELDFKSIADFLVSSNPWFLAVAFGCMLAYILFEALSLHVICRTLGHKCKFRSSVVYSASDVYYSAITPSAAGGQPASAYYMVQDGMPGGSATFALVFNLIAYTGAVIVLGLAAFIINPVMFVGFGAFVKFLVLAGLVFQSLLLAFCIMCMFCPGFIYKCGSGIITLLHKIRIIKKADKWRGRLQGVIDKYKGCLSALREHRALFAIVLLFNIIQRASQMLVTCFVCMAGRNDVPFLEILVMQAYVTLGYNFIPLPGGVGAFEFLYLHIFILRYDKAFILVAMMITRVISYYISMALSGVFTLTYHGMLMRRKRLRLAADIAEQNELPAEQTELSVEQAEIANPEQAGDTLASEQPLPELEDKPAQQKEQSEPEQKEQILSENDETTK